MAQSVVDVVQHLTVLPPFSQVTAKLLAMIDDDTVSIDELNAVVSADPSLAAKVIHLSNSPFYMVSRPVESVREALIILGVNSIKNIVAGISIQQGLAAVQPRTDVFNMIDFWKHSYATAIIAKKMGSQVDRKLSETLYLAGLVHDVGKLIMAYYWPEVWKSIVHTLLISHELYCDVEARMFPQTHSEIAGELFRNWRFPSSITQLVEHHHNESPLSEIARPLQLLRQADLIVNAAGFSFPKGYRDDTLPDIGKDSEKLTSGLQEELNSQIELLGV